MTKWIIAGILAVVTGFGILAYTGYDEDYKDQPGVIYEDSNYGGFSY